MNYKYYILVRLALFNNRRKKKIILKENELLYFRLGRIVYIQGNEKSIQFIFWTLVSKK